MVFSSINLSTFSFIHLLPVTIFFGEEECPYNSERDKEGRNSFLNGRSDGGMGSILECQILNWWKHLCSWFTLSWSLYYEGQNIPKLGKIWDLKMSNCSQLSRLRTISLHIEDTSILCVGFIRDCILTTTSNVSNRTHSCLQHFIRMG